MMNPVNPVHPAILSPLLLPLLALLLNSVPAEEAMKTIRALRTLIVLALLISIASIDTGFAKPKKKKEVLTGTPILWQRPDNISSRDLFLGPGGAAMRPDVRRVTFIKEEKGGY